MKREGRQHGHVITHVTVRDREVRNSARDGSGCRQKMPSKPTNHSKFTGKCGRARCRGCHLDSVNKSKPKTKGEQKNRSCDILTNYRMLSWRLVHTQGMGKSPSLCSGESATTMLAQFIGEDDFEPLDLDLDEESEYRESIIEEKLKDDYLQWENQHYEMRNLCKLEALLPSAFHPLDGSRSSSFSSLWGFEMLQPFSSSEDDDRSWIDSDGEEERQSLLISTILHCL
eukprot:Gb_05015 [translate_table: standard]